MNIEKGILCSLTGAPANFDQECPDYVRDETVKPRLSEDDNIEELQAQITPELLDALLAEQNLPLGIISGAITGIIGAILWAMITVATGYQIGYMALAIGFGVGFTVKTFGKGLKEIFGIWGATISLLSCLLGNALSVIGFAASYNQLDYFEALAIFNYSYLPQIMAETFSVLDLLFYGLAIYAGYRYSFRKISAEELMELMQSRG